MNDQLVADVENQKNELQNPAVGVEPED